MRRIVIVLALAALPGCSTIDPTKIAEALLARNWTFNLTLAGKPAIGAAWQSDKQATTEGASNGSASATPATPVAETDAPSATLETVLTEGDL